MDLLFKNAHLIDCIGDEIRAGIDVLVREDKIAEIGTALKAAAADCKEIDLNGAYLLPGLINCHVHLIWDGDRADPEALIASEPDELVALRAFREARRHLYLGITTVCDTGSQNATVTSLRDAVAAGVLEGPNIVASGPPLGMTGGHVSRIIRPADGCDEVRKTVRNLIKWEKVDFIKVMATGGCYEHGEEPGSPQLTVEEMRVAVEEAHNRGKTVAAHAEGLVGIRNTLKAGIDVIEHGNFADEEAIEQMVKQGTYLCPTIVCFVRMCGPQAKAGGVPDYAVRKGKMVADAQAISFPKAVAAGVQIITGTDAGAPLNPPSDYFTEMELYQKHGMSPMAVLKASTKVAAEALDLPHLGTVEPGKVADLIVARENPLENLGALRNLDLIVKAGKLLTPKIFV